MSVWPAVIGVGGVVLGAIIGGTIALLTGWQSRRWAHQQWLLDRRQDSYTELLTAVQAAMDAGPHADAPERRRLGGDIFRASIRCQIVGSDFVAEAVIPVLGDVPAYIRQADEAARMTTHGPVLQDAMRRGLVRTPKLRP
ncbi:protein of unknown function [Modestobacter italicus]|uniref:Uncharacterized protein n=1 Tax=Modestobacter italicus (strain DSM 44449 / CECT 9708 / BC 501) TaxID=2732864 RepID=I4EU98_MODI5|nr:hypothetical protein [Modestobacter marinus]CCH86961.1 protein of unknown function [Modestobacter marinus]